MAEISAFKINGVVDTSKTVLSNLNALCKAVGCWLTYDSTTGFWSVVINKPGSSTKSFNDSNIIGSISITGTGVDQLYNAVEVQYPNQDLLSTTDSANFELTSEYRFPNELDKRLTLQFDLINNPVQAQYLGTIELKQNRVDKIIQFRTDYTSLGVKAGDLIDVTNSVYGYTNKVFRVTKVAEEDADDGSIQLSITGLEYDEGVYDTTGLIYSARTTSTGVVPKSMNTALTALDVTANGGTPLVYSFQTGFVAVTGVSPTTSYSSFFDPTSLPVYNLNKSFKLPYTGTYRINYFVNWGAVFDVSGGQPENMPDTIRKWTVILLYKNGSLMSDDLGAGQSTTILKGDDPNADSNAFGVFTANKGDTIGFYAGLKSDLYPVANSKPYSQISVTGSLIFLGP